MANLQARNIGAGTDMVSCGSLGLSTLSDIWGCNAKKMIKRLLPFGIIEWQQAKTERQQKFKKKFFNYAKSLEDGGRFSCRWEDRYPCLTDNIACTNFEPH